MGTLPILKVREDKDWYSDKISTQIRTLIAAVLSIDWLFLLGKDINTSWQAKLVEQRSYLIWVAILCVVVLAIDLAQYLFGYFNSTRTLQQAEEDKQETTFYDPNSWLRWGNRWCFRFKILLVSVPCGLILFVLARLLPNP